MFSLSLQPNLSNLKLNDDSVFDEVSIPVPVPATSIEKLSKLKDKLLGTLPLASAEIGDRDADDESTPLVSELSTPSHSCSEGTRHEFSPNESTDASPSSNKSLPLGGERSIAVDYSDKIGLVIREGSARPKRSLSRQDAEDFNEPETSVWRSLHWKALRLNRITMRLVL